ncbi:hypothetical protein ACJJTC_016543 [Scirpophaga incertulas]
MYLEYIQLKIPFDRRSLTEYRHIIVQELKSTGCKGWCAARRRRGRPRVAGRMAAWRAHAYGAPAAELRLEAARVPPLTAPDHLLVHVRAASLNPLDRAMLGECRTAGSCTLRTHNPVDAHKRKDFHMHPKETKATGSRVLNALRAAEGLCGWSSAGAGAGAGAGGEGSEFPLVVGRDFVGTVARAGPAARARRGARVWGVLPPHRPGALADYVLARDAWVGPAPAALDDWQAGGAPVRGAQRLCCAACGGAGP